MRSNNMTHMTEKAFLEHLKEMSLISQTLGLLEWDVQTGMPEAAAEHRSEVVSYMSGKHFDLANGEKMTSFIDYFSENLVELSPFAQEVFADVKESYELNNNVPQDRIIAYSKALSKAHQSWVQARDAKDFAIFLPALEELVAFNKEFIPYRQKNQRTDYDVLLDLYEPDMTVAKLDDIFETLKEGIISLRKEIAEKGTPPETDFIHRYVSKEAQKEFVLEVIEQLGYDLSRGRLDDTIHPFMLGINRQDARITTRWNEHDFLMATLGVIHEAGHGMYEQNIDEKYDHTPLSRGTSMGIHESQSLFNEIIVGSSRAFWQRQYPRLQAITGDTFADIDFETFYRGIKQSKSSLIRIEADALTYPLHIIIRYEIEKMIFNEEINLADLPQIWNDKYEEYLGIRPENDLEGILQDVHWAGGSFGYFPSYALGFMYAAQLYHAMNQQFDVEAILASEDYSRIIEWNKKHIHQFGASKKPNELILNATGEALNPTYLIDYMRKIFFDVYQVQ